MESLQAVAPHLSPSAQSVSYFQAMHDGEDRCFSEEPKLSGEADIQGSKG